MGKRNITGTLQTHCCVSVYHSHSQLQAWHAHKVTAGAAGLRESRKKPLTGDPARPHYTGPPPTAAPPQRTRDPNRRSSAGCSPAARCKIASHRIAPPPPTRSRLGSEAFTRPPGKNRRLLRAETNGAALQSSGSGTEPTRPRPHGHSRSAERPAVLLPQRAALLEAKDAPSPNPALRLRAAAGPPCAAPARSGSVPRPRAGPSGTRPSPPTFLPPHHPFPPAGDSRARRQPRPHGRRPSEPPAAQSEPTRPGRALPPHRKERPASPPPPKHLGSYLEVLLEADRQYLGHGGGCWLGLQAGAGPASRLSGVREARGSGTAMAERATAGEESRGAPEAAPAGGRIPPRKEEAGPHLPGAACAARKDPTALRHSHAAAPIGAAEGSATGRDYFGSHHSSSPLRLPFFFFLPHHATEVRLRHFRSALAAPVGHVPGAARPGKVTRGGIAAPRPCPSARGWGAVAMEMRPGPGGGPLPLVGR